MSNQLLENAEVQSKNVFFLEETFIKPMMKLNKGDFLRNTLS